MTDSNDNRLRSSSSSGDGQKRGGPPWWILLTLAIGWLPGIYAWRWYYEAGALVTGSELKTLLSVEQRFDVLVWGGASLVAVLLVYVAAYFVRQPRLGVADHCRSLNRLLAVVLLVPLVSIVLGDGLESSRDFSNMLFIVASVAVFATWAYFMLPESVARDTLPSADPWAAPLSSKVPWLVVLAMLVAYTARFSFLSILDHQGLRTANWDLGIYENIVWNTAHGDFLGCSFCRAGKHYTAHFDPILAVFTPIYRLSPRAETLLILQSLWLAAGGIPLFLYARRKLEHAWWALAMVAAYFLTTALHGANLYDFHSLSLLIPTVIFAIYFLDAERYVGYAIAMAVLLATREDLALLSLFIALYAWSLGRPRTAAVTAIVAIVYFIIIRAFVMGEATVLLDTNTETKSFVWYYKELIPIPGEGAFGLVLTGLTDPALVVMVLFQEKKLLYFLKLLVPLLFLPLVGGKKRILLLYGLLFIGLATRPYVFSTNFQYSSLLIPFLLLCTVDAIASVKGSPAARTSGLDLGRLQKVLLLGVVFASALTATQYGALRENRALRGGFERIRFVQTPEERARYEELREIVARIPSDATVSADRHSGPHLSNRAQIVQWPKLRKADYVVLRVKTKNYTRTKRYKDILKRGIYEIDYESPEFVLLRRAEQAEGAEDDLEKAHDEPKDESDDPRSRD